MSISLLLPCNFIGVFFAFYSIVFLICQDGFIPSPLLFVIIISLLFVLTFFFFDALTL